MSSEPVRKNIAVTRTARYFMSGNITGDTRQVWIVLHGYAQHAGYFLRKFEPLFSPRHVFVAPEGLSRFYLRGTSGRVVASWMTSEDRQEEINDYVLYLDKLVEDLELDEKIGLNVLGFSQGVATAARWVAKGKIKPKRVILYAGVFPPDLDPGFEPDKWKDLQVDVLVGDNDEYYQPEVFSQTYAPLQAVNGFVKIHHFSGGHEIFPEVLQKLLD